MKRSSVAGARDVASAFRKVTPGLAVPLNEASRKALRPTLAAAKANLRANGNVDTGGLLRALTIKKAPKAERDRVEHLVGPSADNPHYRLGHLVEFGTAPHLVDGRVHPGSQAFPFLAPAFEETKGRVTEIFGREIGPAIERRAAKLARKKVKP